MTGIVSDAPAAITLQCSEYAQKQQARRVAGLFAEFSDTPLVLRVATFPQPIDHAQDTEPTTEEH